MQSEINPIQEYLEKRKHIMDYFKCDGDFFIKPLLDAQWFIRRDDDFYILSYWDGTKPRANAVIVKKAGQPLIFETKGHTMVIAIDCVKIAFLFENKHRITAEI